MMFGGCVSWLFKKQGCVALSSCEAEYISLCASPKEAIWLSNLLCEILGANSSTPFSILFENFFSISYAQNQSINHWNKQIDIRHHFVGETLAAKQIELRHCRTDEKKSEILTKLLIRVKFVKFRSKLGIISRSFPV